MRPPAVLGGIKRKVGGTHDLFPGDAIMRRNRNPDRCADDAAPFFKAVGLAHHGDDLHRQIAQHAAIVDIGQHDLKFVAAQPANLAFAVNRPPKPCGDLFEQFITRRVAKRVVNLLEAIKVDHHHRAIAARSLERGQRRINMLRHAVAVA